jgi:hypothetical protein
MAASATELLDELKALRKGRGVHAGKISDHVGPGLREICGIVSADGEESIRRKLTNRLGALVGSLPDDLGLAVRAALGLHPEAQQPFLGDRVQWLADQLKRDRRTARRRLDDGLVRLAQAAAGPAEPPPAPTSHLDDGWYVADFHALLRLDQPTPEAIERRGIVAERDGIDSIVALITVHRDPTDRSGGHDLLMEVLYGATLVRKEHDAGTQFRFVLKLPRTLRAGERHEYAALFRIPPNQLMRSRYVHTSPRRCDLFDLRIRFDLDRPPEQIWRVQETFFRAPDSPPIGDPVALDSVGELHLQFSGLKPGFGYGAQWTELPTRELQHRNGAGHALPRPADRRPG